MPVNSFFRVLATLVLALAAAVGCVALHTPLPWMIGPLLATSVVSIAGGPTQSWGPLRNAGQWTIGAALGHLGFDGVRDVQTASGPVGAAPVTLGQVAVAGARVEHVQALVVKDGLPHSLLGMSYLGRLSRFEATPSGLTLRP